MDKLTKQFFGDAKRMQLSSQEKALLWQGISTFASAKQINLSALEKADTFNAIAKHMQKNPMQAPEHSAVFNWFAFHKMIASTMIAVLIIGVGGGSVAYAAQAALPGEALYSVKVDITEPLIDAALTFDPERRAEWERRRLKRRLKEVEHLSNNERFTADHRTRLQERVEHRMEMLQEHLDDMPEDQRTIIQDRVDDVIERHQKFLDAVESGIASPEEVRAFKEHVGGVRNKAQEQWRRRPGGNRPVPPNGVREQREMRLPPDREHIPNEILRLPDDQTPPKKEERLMPPRNRSSQPKKEENLIPQRDRQPPQKEERLMPPSDRQPPQKDKNIFPPSRELPQKRPIGKPFAPKGFDEFKPRLHPPVPRL